MNLQRVQPQYRMSMYRKVSEMRYYIVPSKRADLAYQTSYKEGGFSLNWLHAAPARPSCQTSCLLHARKRERINFWPACKYTVKELALDLPTNSVVDQSVCCMCTYLTN